MEKAAILCPELAKQLGWVVKTVHVAHHGSDAESWKECQQDVCRSSVGLLKIACNEVLHPEVSH